MPVITAPELDSGRDQPSHAKRHRFTRSDYYRMAETGILPPDARVELLDGEIYEMSPIGFRHGGLVRRLHAFLMPRVAGRAICSVQSPLILNDASEPEPDIVLALHRDDFYIGSHPAAADALLVIEVAETSLLKDLHYKLRLYAAAGIGDYWAVDADQRTIFIHRDPAGATYLVRSAHHAGEIISPARFPDANLDLNWLFSY